jgi:acetyl esterase/lipase
MKIISLVVLLSMVMNTSIMLGQSKVIDIWQGKIPGSLSNPNIVQTIDSGDHWVKMKGVTNPVMDMYPAPSGKTNGTAVIICPGGGYGALAVSHEGSQVAEWLNGLGVTAFVLKYRLPDPSIMVNTSVGPLQDAQEAIRIVRRHAKEWNINPNKIGVLGFSAGGHLAATLSTHFNEKVYETVDETSARPDFSILIYPVVSMDASITHMGSRENLLGKNPSDDLVRHFSNELQVNKETPPAFIVHSLDDPAVPVVNSVNYAFACKKFGVPCELHIFESGGHGYGMRKTNGTESTWPEVCTRWLQVRGLISNE